MNSTCEIRRVQIDDLSAIKQLASIGDINYWGDTYLNTWSITYVATLKEEGIIGYISGFVSNLDCELDELDTNNMVLEITGLVVSKEYRKNGIGSQLLDKVLKTEGVKLFTTIIPEYLDIALHLLESRGFTIVEKISNYCDCGIAGILLHKQI